MGRRLLSLSSAHPHSVGSKDRGSSCIELFQMVDWRFARLIFSLIQGFHCWGSSLRDGTLLTLLLLVFASMSDLLGRISFIAGGNERGKSRMTSSIWAVGSPIQLRRFPLCSETIAFCLPIPYGLITVSHYVWAWALRSIGQISLWISV